MKRINPETFLEYQFLSDPSISPDGKYTAFVVHNADVETDGYISSLHIICNKTGSVKKLTTIGSVKGFVWISDTVILFPSARCPKIKEKLAQGEEITQYYTIDITGGEAQQAHALDMLAGVPKKLTATKCLVSAQYDNNRPCLDGLSKAERIETLKNYKEAGYSVFQEVPFWANAQGVVNRKRNRLCIVDHETGTNTYITSPFFGVEGYDANDTYILYQGSEYETVRPVKSGLYLYTIATGETKCIFEPGTLDIKLALLWGTDKAVISYGTDERYGLNQNGNAYILDLNTGKDTFLAEHTHARLGGNLTGSDARYGGGKSAKVVGDTLYYNTTCVNHSYLNSLDLKTGEIKVLTTDGSVDSFDVLGDKIVMVAMKGDQIGEIYTIENCEEKKLSSFNDFVGADYSISTPEPITSISRDGFEIYGYVMKPIGYIEGNKYPAILHIHGGPRTVFSDIFHNEMQLWANAGYFVIFCNPRGGDGRGNDFGELKAQYGGVDYEDIMDFTDAALAAYSDIDDTRVGVTGGSYGGFMTNWIIGHTNRFKAACAQRSIANWTSFEGTTDIGYFFAKDQTGASHVDDYALQWKQSPLAYAHNATTPTLFIHSDEDYRCWMVEGLQMFTALKLNGVTSRLCLFKGDNHELSRSGKPRNRIKRMEEILGWMDSYLK